MIGLDGLRPSQSDSGTFHPAGVADELVRIDEADHQPQIRLMEQGIDLNRGSPGSFSAGNEVWRLGVVSQDAISIDGFGIQKAWEARRRQGLMKAGGDQDRNRRRGNPHLV